MLQHAANVALNVARSDQYAAIASSPRGIVRAIHPESYLKILWVLTNPTWELRMETASITRICLLMVDWEDLLPVFRWVQIAKLYFRLSRLVLHLLCSKMEPLHRLLWAKLDYSPPSTICLDILLTGKLLLKAIYLLECVNRPLSGNSLMTIAKRLQMQEGPTPIVFSLCIIQISNPISC